MSFCTNCGKEILEDAMFCDACGAPIATESAPEQEITASNIETDDNLIREEQEFLDNTHRLLRWERKAWSITGKFFLICGIIFVAFGALFTVVGIIGILSEAGLVAAPFVTMGLIYICAFSIYLVIGIIMKKTADKMPIYLDSLYNDFSITNARSGSVGMMVFSIIFGGVHTIFFIINFTRLKSSGDTINRILKRQGKI